MSRASARYPATWQAPCAMCTKPRILQFSICAGPQSWVVPEIQLKDLPEAVLGVLAAVQRFIVKRDAMIEIVADGKIEEDEQDEWDEIMDRMNNLFVAMANMRFSKGGHRT